jgi:hypothetical protein
MGRSTTLLAPGRINNGALYVIDKELCDGNLEQLVSGMKQPIARGTDYS